MNYEKFKVFFYKKLQEERGSFSVGGGLSTGGGGGGGGVAFTIIQTDAGTDPVADSDTDTLTLTSAGGTITITGDSATDTVDFALSAALQSTISGKAPAASPTFTGSVTFGNYKMNPGETDEGNSSTADTINWANNSVQKSTLTGNCTYTFSNPQTGGAYVLRLYQGAGSFTVTWPASVKWTDDDGAPDTSAASKIRLINFLWDGTNYWATYSKVFS